MVQSALIGLFGLIFLLVGLFYSTTAPDSDTLNIGLMQNQLILVHIGLALWIVAAFLYPRPFETDSQKPTAGVAVLGERSNVVLISGLIIFLLITLLAM